MGKTVSIYLGSKCNLNCSYCHRENGKELEKISNSFLAILRNYTHIRFMGGEPTMYMSQIKYIIRQLPKTIQYSITTNGINFKLYKQFFLSNNFQIIFSYDGDCSLRGYDPFTYEINYPNVGVSTTIFHSNTDFSILYKQFAEKEKIIKRGLSFYPHIMHETSSYNSRYSLTIEDYKELTTQIINRVKSLVDVYEQYNFINNKYLGLFSQLYKAYHANYSQYETYCVNSKRDKVDLDGNYLTCLYIRDEKPEDLERIYNTKLTKCLSCSVHSMCGGACIKSKTHSKECFYYKTLYTWFKSYYEIHKAAIEEINRNYEDFSILKFRSKTQ